MIKTHLAIGLAVALYFLPFVNDEFIFFSMVIISTLLPEAGSVLTFIKKKKSPKPEKNPGSVRVIHTYTFAVAVSIFFALFYPVLALPFFIGYSFHLFADSFTIQGIKPFWPLKYTSTGPVRVGGSMERGIFVSFILVDLVLGIVFLATRF